MWLSRELKKTSINYSSINNPLIIMMILFIYSIFLLNIFSHVAAFNQKEGDEVTFTVIYDNYSSSEQCTGDWGFSCLIEGMEKTILFDTGTKPEIFKKNLENLSIDIGDATISCNRHDAAR